MAIQTTTNPADAPDRYQTYLNRALEDALDHLTSTYVRGSTNAWYRDMDALIDAARAAGRAGVLTELREAGKALANELVLAHAALYEAEGGSYDHLVAARKRLAETYTWQGYVPVLTHPFMQELMTDDHTD